jgi:hypothetical protein
MVGMDKVLHMTHVSFKMYVKRMKIHVKHVPFCKFEGCRRSNEITFVHLIIIKK